VYNSLTPLFRLLDRVMPGAGLSTVVVSAKPELTQDQTNAHK
jgi:hypothetical protein